MEALASDSHDIFYFCLDVSGMASNQNSKAGKQKNYVQFLKKNTLMALDSAFPMGTIWG